MTLLWRAMVMVEPVVRSSNASVLYAAPSHMVWEDGGS
jgi:hypothetical protein